MRWLLPICLLAACAPDVRIAPKPTDDPDIPGETDEAAEVAQPDIDTTAPSLDVGAHVPDCPGDAEISVGNVGDARLNLQLVTVEGDDADAFSIVAPDALPDRLAPGAWTPITVAFVGTERRTYAADLVIRSDDPDEASLRLPLTAEVPDPVDAEELFIQEDPAPTDILWVMDYSYSMDTERERLSDEIGTFFGDYVDIGLDWKLAVTSADQDCGQPMGDLMDSTWDPQDAVDEFTWQTTTFRPSSGCIGSYEQGFGGASAFIGAHPDFLRTDANFAVVVVSDEIDQTPTTVPIFAAWLASLKGGSMQRVSFSAMVGPFIGNPFGNACPLGSPPEANAFPAPRYHNAIDQTGGVWGDLCAFAFEPFLRHLAATAAGMWVEVKLQAAPEASTITVEIGGVPLAQGKPNGWTWRKGDKTLTFHGDGVPDPGDAVVVSYTVPETCP